MRVLILSADDGTAKEIGAALGATMKTERACTPSDALEMAIHRKYHLYIIDMAACGVEPCRVIRRFSSAAIIFISPKHNEAEAVAGFEAGADDYLPKPYGMLELCSRVRAVLRRCEPSKGALAWIDRVAMAVMVDGKTVNLTPMEYGILMRLAAANGVPVSKAALVKDVWGVDSYASDDALKVRISSLRSKIGKSRIETVRGYGYRLVTE